MTEAAQVTTPSPFESFNARALEPEQVAETFIPPDQYFELIKRSHSLIIGPRGSGKTTLLKMLQARALEAWSHPLADEVRAQVDFTGVFVPTDRSWSVQVGALGRARLGPEFADRLGHAAFTTHVLRSLVAAIRQRAGTSAIPNVHRFPHRRISLSREDEAAIVRVVAKGWHADLEVPSLSALHLAMTERLSRIQEIANRESLPGAARADADTPFLYLGFLEAAGLAIEAFEEMGGAAGGKWALLFDELELAPADVRKELLAAPRGTDERFLFKLSLSPFTTELSLLDDPLGPAPQNDYAPILLTYARKEEGYAFCRSLLNSMLASAGMPVEDAEAVLGWSVFDTDPEDYRGRRSAYSADSRLVRELRELVDNDRTFRAYIADRAIDLDQLDILSHVERAADIRKLRALVAVRRVFRRPDQEAPSGQRLRSRKNPRIYAGANALFAIVEGNPRWFIGIVGRILDRHKLSKRARYPIRPEFQTQEIDRAANKFRALLRTIPLSVRPASGTPLGARGVLDFLDAVGRAFQQAIVLDAFSPEPPGSFTVDAHTGDDVLEVIGLALNAGALIHVPDPGSQVALGSLRGKRYRLSYLLATQYGLPLRIDRAVSLSNLLATPRNAPGVLPGMEDYT